MRRACGSIRFATSITGPGGTEDRLRCAEGYGQASVELEAPATPRTMFQSGSVGKQFTAALVLLLAAESRLGLDDPVSKRLPSNLAGSDPGIIARAVAALYAPALAAPPPR